MKLFLCFLLLFLYRLSVFIISERNTFSSYISENGFSFAGILRLIDFRWIFTAQSTEKKHIPSGEYVKVDAKVIEADKISNEYYDEHNELQVSFSYHLMVRYYVGTECITSYIDSEKLAEETELFCKIDNPQEVYLADKNSIEKKSEDEQLVSLGRDAVGAAGFIVSALYLFSLFMRG